MLGKRGAELSASRMDGIKQITCEQVIKPEQPKRVDLMAPDTEAKKKRAKRA